MAVSKKEMKIGSNPKNTRQGEGKNTKYAKSSSNGARKKYRGQGRWFNWIFKSQLLPQKVMVGISFWNLDIRIQKNLTFNRDSIL